MNELHCCANKNKNYNNYFKKVAGVEKSDVITIHTLQQEHL